MYTLWRLRVYFLFVDRLNLGRSAHLKSFSLLFGDRILLFLIFVSYDFIGLICIKERIRRRMKN